MKEMFTELAAGSFDFCDRLGAYTDTLCDIQLRDSRLWKIFTNLFAADGVDDADLGWRCEYWGKMMRGACFTYKSFAGGDDELYSVLENTVRDMLGVQEPSGRISTYSVAKEFSGWDIWGRKYVMLGMIYFLDICKDDTLKEKIIVSLKRQADYMLSKLGKKEDGKLVIAECASYWDGLSSCSILEPFMLLYNLTKEKRYLDFAEYIVSFGGTLHQNLFELAAENKTAINDFSVRKAYEMMSCFDGLAEYVKVTDDERLRQAVINLGDRIIKEEVTIIGCLGCHCEEFDHSVISQFDENNKMLMQETCVTVTWMKFLWQLWRMTGDKKYMDNFELSAYNAMSAALKRNIDPSANGGIILPIHSYNPLRHATRNLNKIGGKKSITDESCYGCCVCISSAGFALTALASAGVDSENRVFINMYRNGTVRCDGFSIKMSCDYPASGKITVDVTADKPGKLAFRIPAFAESFLCDAKGCRVVDGYMYVDFNESMTFNINIPMEVVFITPDDVADIPVCVKNYVSVRRGPLVFAYEENFDEEPVCPVDVNAPTQYIPSNDDGISGLKIGLDGGGTLTLVDYPSSGQDGTSKVCAWIKTH